MRNPIIFLDIESCFVDFLKIMMHIKTPWNLDSVDKMKRMGLGS